MVPPGMGTFRNRTWRLVALFLVLPILVSACEAANAEIPICATTVTQEPTGDLTVDLIGSWKGTTDEERWHHPVAYLGAGEDQPDTGRRIWMFRSDGSGHVWYASSFPGEAFENDTEFTWVVVEGRLVVDDLPAATIEMRTTIHALLHPLDQSVDPLLGISMIRCDLVVPEDVRGLDG